MSERRILIAGIGNIFFGDDAFGCEVVRCLTGRSWPVGVRVKDFGISGLDLAYELMDGWDLAILIDAAPRGEAPGTVYLLELDSQTEGAETLIETHGMSPAKVLALARTLGEVCPWLRLVGCEPLTVEEPAMGLSEPVRAALPEAVRLVEGLVKEFLAAIVFGPSTSAESTVFTPESGPICWAIAGVAVLLVVIVGAVGSRSSARAAREHLDI